MNNRRLSDYTWRRSRPATIVATSTARLPFLCGRRQNASKPAAQRLNIIAWPPDPCGAQIGFADSAGGAVRPTKVVNLSPGQGDFLDLNCTTLALPFGGRAEVHPVVALLQSPSGVVSACQATAQIVDSVTAFSLVLAPGVAAWPPNPVFGPQGVAWGQVLRLNIVAWPPDPVAPVPCIAQVGFVDKLGNPAGPAPKTVNLISGHADHLDIAGSTLLMHFGQRVELRAVVAILPAATPLACAASVEIYDQFSGRTWAWMDPRPTN